MITHIVGEIVEQNESTLVIEAGGMGYEVYCSSRYLYEQNHIGTKVKLYIHEHIKEDGHDLYGFYDKQDRELFRKLISVSGIGPKAGMQILNLYSCQEVVSMISEGDSKSLNKVSGIGPKTASRIILELKDSIGKLFGPDLSLLQTGLKDHSASQEAKEALEALGYGANEAKKAVEAIDDYKSSSEELIKRALKLLM